MRALIQRVKRAEVRVEGERTGRIGPGLLILVGVAEGDDEEDAAWLARKCAGLRIFDDEEGRLERSVLEVGGKALVVSQFTLYGDARKGRRPSWSKAMSGEEAERLVEVFVRLLSAEDVEVAGGRFGARMEVELVNDGPVTLMVESPS
ncbi:MAG: D-aminoacyl-tRNA deacylase [bacterium]